MTDFYDELDAQGAVVRTGFVLGMYDVLPDGHRWVANATNATNEVT